ncbi:MAG: GNAT family N-acetyltransferase [Rhodospirillales bacterium]|nr:GNAT family N-acetyltransferase [Rhodospirillales bacterium]
MALPFSLAELMDQAGEGIPGWLWAQDAAEGQSALDVGMARARRSEGAFSYPNATVLEYQGQVAAMLLAYLQPGAFDVDKELDGVPDFLVPIVELECLAPGSFYINAIAVYPQFRSKGFDSLLMAEAERLARKKGTQALSLITFEGNASAVRFYLRLGFVIAAQRLVVKHESTSHAGDEYLMLRTLF